MLHTENFGFFVINTDEKYNLKENQFPVTI